MKTEVLLGFDYKSGSEIEAVKMISDYIVNGYKIILNDRFYIRFEYEEKDKATQYQISKDLKLIKIILKYFDVAYEIDETVESA